MAYKVWCYLASGQWGYALSWDLMTKTDICLPHEADGNGGGRGTSPTQAHAMARLLSTLSLEKGTPNTTTAHLLLHHYP